MDIKPKVVRQEDENLIIEFPNGNLISISSNFESPQTLIDPENDIKYVMIKSPDNETIQFLTMSEYYYYIRNMEILPVSNLASSNLKLIYKRIDLLEELYNEMSKNCRGYIYSLPGLSVSDRITIRNELIKSGYDLTEMPIYIQNPSKYKYLFTTEFTLSEIRDFLDYLSGNMISSEDSLEQYLLLQNKYTGQFLFFIIIEPYLEWLFGIVQYCRKINKSIKFVQQSVKHSYYKPEAIFYHKTLESYNKNLKSYNKNP